MYRLSRCICTEIKAKIKAKVTIREKGTGRAHHEGTRIIDCVNGLDWFSGYFL